MTTATSQPSGIATLLAFLRGELAPRPGRMRAVWRITAGCTITVVIGMVFQIPLPAYMAYIVFLVSRGESAATLITGVGGLVAGTLAVALSLLFYLLDASEPGLRIPLLALSTFIAMFFARTSTLGPIVFLGGFVLVLSQTLIDDVPTTEVLLRVLLWLWVVVMVPVFVAVLIDLLWGENPARLLRARVDHLLTHTAAVLDGQSHLDVMTLQEDAIDTLALHDHASLWDPGLKAKAAADLRLFEGLIAMLSLLSLLPADAPAAVRQPLSAGIDACRVAVNANDPPTMDRCDITPAALAQVDPDTRPVVLALEESVNQLLEGVATRLTSKEAKVAKAKRLFVPDAFTNRSHVRFALKTTLAVTLAYFIYTLLDWPGIRTAVTTCFFVALGSMAETMHKLSLRLSGAIAGGAIAGFCIVYLLPHMTEIGQLSLLIAAVSALCAWVATSSERLAYAGMQMAFAFYLGVLDGYSPTTDLTSLRDRVVGILLGNILMSVIFSTLWPVGALQVVRSSMATTLDLLAKLITTPATGERPIRLPVIQELVKARKLSALALFEHGSLGSLARTEPLGRLTLKQLDRIASSVFVVLGQKIDDAEAGGQANARAQAGRWFSLAATQARRGDPPPTLEGWVLSDIDTDTAQGAPASRQAMHRLRAEIADVAPAR